MKEVAIAAASAHTTCGRGSAARLHEVSIVAQQVVSRTDRGRRGTEQSTCSIWANCRYGSRANSPQTSNYHHIAAITSPPNRRCCSSESHFMRESTALSSSMARAPS